jgi:hypothetical protein
VVYVLAIADCPLLTVLGISLAEPMSWLNF